MKKGMQRIEEKRIAEAGKHTVEPDANLRIDFSLIARQEPGTRRKTIVNELKRVGYPCLSDCMVNRDRGGTDVLVEIEKMSKRGQYNPETGATEPQSTRTWKIQLLCDEWGMPFKPGDRLRWVADFVNRDSGQRGVGRKLTGRQIKNAIRRGDGDQFFEYHSAVVDDRICIDVGYADAVTELQNSGVHFETGVAITRKRERSRAPRVVPPGHPLEGKTKNAVNWLVKEIPPWLYDTLPRYDSNGNVIEGDGPSLVTEPDDETSPTDVEKLKAELEALKAEKVEAEAKEQARLEKAAATRAKKKAENEAAEARAEAKAEAKKE